MSTFLLEFTEFFSLMLTAITSFFVWFSSTVIGEIILFILVMYIFMYIVKLIISLKQ